MKGALHDMSVLVVDDSADNAEMLAKLLKTTGATVASATSGPEALQILGDQRFDAVISDIAMPGMDGFEFLRRLRLLPGHEDVPVLALTGFGQREDVTRAKAAGFHSHLTKPIELDLLTGLLRSLPRRAQ